MRILLALTLLAASAAQATEKGQARFSGGKMKSQSVQKSQKSKDSSAFNRRWSGARGKGTVSSGSGKVSFRANTQGYTRMAEGDQRPQDFGLSAPVAGAKVQPLGHQTAPGGPFAERTIDGGGQIGFDPGKSLSLDSGRGVHQGPADKLPPVSTLTGASAAGSSGSGGASGATGITANSDPAAGQ